MPFQFFEDNGKGEKKRKFKIKSDAIKARLASFKKGFGVTKLKRTLR